MAFCDCPGKDDGWGWYGNSITYLKHMRKFVCGRTGLEPRPEAHGEMIAEAGPYVALMEQEEVGKERLELIKDVAKELGRSAGEAMDRAVKEAFNAE